MLQKCQVCGILPHHTRPKHALTSSDAPKPYTRPYTALRYPLRNSCSDTPPHLQTSRNTNRQHETLADTIRHQKTPKNDMRTKDVNLNGHTSSNCLFGCLGTPVGVAWCLLVSVVALNCPEITGGGFWEHNTGVYVSLWGLNFDQNRA